MTRTFLVVFEHFSLCLLQNHNLFIKSYVICLNKRKLALIYRKCIVLTLLNNENN